MPEKADMRKAEELCLVCGDKASGYHYNALTCEGCKGFFRRSVTRKAAYLCKYGAKCDIDMYMRRKCQHCRLTKCMLMGMRAELVIPEEQCRMKREAKQRLRHSVPHSSSAADSPPVPSTSLSSSSSPDSLREGEESAELLCRLLTLHSETRAPSEDSLSQLSYSSRKEEPFSPRCFFQHLAELTVIEAQLSHEFVRNLPGFERLSEHDQSLIQKACKSELLMLRAIRSYDPANDCIVIGNDKRQWRYTQEAYASAGAGLESSQMFSIARSLAPLQLDLLEYLLLSAILVFSDRLGLESPGVVSEIQEVYACHLHSVSRSAYPTQLSRFPQLLLKLTDLRAISIQQMDSLMEEKPLLLHEQFTDVGEKIPLI